MLSLLKITIFPKRSRGSLQKTVATCLKCETNLILAYLHRSQRHSSSQSQKCHSTLLSDKSKFLLRISSTTGFIFLTQCLAMVPCWKSFPNMNRERAENYLHWLAFLLARGTFYLFSREPLGSIVLDQKFCLRMKCLEVICSYLTRSWTHVFVIVKTKSMGVG